MCHAGTNFGIFNVMKKIKDIYVARGIVEGFWWLLPYKKGQNLIMSSQEAIPLNIQKVICSNF